MTKKIDWLNHGLEFSVVLIGILIAFQLNKCSDDRSKTELLDNHLKYIKIECEENAQRLSTYVEHTEEKLQHCDSLLLEIGGAKDVNKIRNLSVSLLDLRNVDLVNDSYKVLSESGDIRYFKDYDKKRSIITLYETFDKIDAINASHQKLYDNHFYPYLKQHFDLVNWRNLNLNDLDQIQPYYSNEYGNVISTYRFLLSAKLKLYKEEKTLFVNYLNPN